MYSCINSVEVACFALVGRLGAWSVLGTACVRWSNSSIPCESNDPLSNDIDMDFPVVPPFVQDAVLEPMPHHRQENVSPNYQ